MHHLPTAWQQFYNSGFRYRPILYWVGGMPNWKTNKAKWAQK